jgi:hypothetical protein
MTTIIPQTIHQWLILASASSLGALLCGVALWLIMSKAMNGPRAARAALDRAGIPDANRGEWDLSKTHAGYQKEVGALENIMYSFSVVFGYPQFIPAWLAIKYIAGPSTWVPDPVGRTMYNRSLFGSGLNAVLGFLVGLIARWGITKSAIITLNNDTNSVMNAANLVETHKLLGISLESWLTIAAIVLGPILALLAQRELDNLREEHQRQVRIFRELMITRAQRLSQRHVEALNAVPLEFKKTRKNKNILDAWKAYFDHLGTDSTKDPSAWARGGATLLVELLYEMSQRLGPKMKKLSIESEVYLPQMFNTIEMEQQALRRQILEILGGKGTRKIPVAVFEQRFPDIKLPPKADGPENKK